jgi:hypothetical protein
MCVRSLPSLDCPRRVRPLNHLVGQGMHTPSKGVAAPQVVVEPDIHLGQLSVDAQQFTGVAALAKDLFSLLAFISLVLLGRIDHAVATSTRTPMW